MLVSPLPVLSLVILVQVAEIVVRIAMGFHRPLIVENDFVVVPAMSIMVVRVVIVAAMLRAAACRGQGQCQCTSDQACSYELFVSRMSALSISGHFSLETFGCTASSDSCFGTVSYRKGTKW